ncbi:MAG: peptide chain release factor N(5)-glutamine methyltransferase [Gammaproteobacteria bacterium]|nr:peptide chain release factor N(5)-glutamine methyltransferase [Gammaproteobacteria bacterium]
MTIKTTLQAAQKTIALLDAQVLLAHVLGKNRAYLHAESEAELTPVQQQAFNMLVQRRVDGEPVAYLTGIKEFWSLTLHVTPDVLIPRPETELLVELILNKLPATSALKVVDLGTGSGAIALALASERSAWQITAVDQSAAALAVARDNAERLALTNVEFIASDWCQQLPVQQYAAIVANPPYIVEGDPHLTALRYEPQTALVAADHGLADIATIAAQARHYLLPQGILAIEHGSEQGAAVRELLCAQGYHVDKTYRDLQGLERVTLALSD